ncbi:RsiV family protein [Chryseobacterium sp. SIMBA_028]|uniref:RsiV family protein n=1 Tax=Chryseobacterium sp. SIMBA_028 TaxID=3085771 RepID=UPI003978FA1C
MKNIIAVLALSSFFVFSACNKKDAVAEVLTEKTEDKKSNEFIVDSVTVKDSTRVSDSLKLAFTSKLLTFPTLKDKALLDSIYFQHEKIKDFSKAGLQAYLENKKNDYFSTMKNDNKDWYSDITYAQEWYSSSYMNLKSNVNGYMHIQYAGSAYIGGAHEEYGFSERVFDLKNNKKLELKDITSIPENKLETLLMKNLDKINSGAMDGNGEVKNSEMLLVERIPVSDNFYFDEKNLYFHYSPYEITAFAAGDITIPVSWEELKGTINAEFKERMKIK